MLGFISSIAPYDPALANNFTVVIVAVEQSLIQMLH